MTSFASEMPESPGCISQFDLYKNKPYVNPYEEQKQQLSSVQDENIRLKASLTRVQAEYEELRDESNYQRAKVSELTELMSSSTSPPSLSPSPQHSSSDASSEHTDSTIQSSLIEKSLQNAELTFALDQMKIELHNTEARLADLEIQKRANNKLLLEMGDVIRTLNAVDIKYAAYTPKGESLSAQQQSIKNIKLKVEVMLKDRKLIIQKCKELEEVSRAQEQKIIALEAQFHITNTFNNSQGVALDGIAKQREISPTVSMAESTLSGDASNSQHSSVVSAQSNVGDAVTSFAPTDAAASEIVRQSEEIAKFKKQEEDHKNEIKDLQRAQNTHEETISRLKTHNERLYTQLDGTRKSLGATKDHLENAVIKRDELKDNLVDIIAHYKELQVEHDISSDQISQLQTMIVKLESKVREAQRKLEYQKALEKKKPKQNEEKTPIDCRMDDLLVAYSKAQKQIVELEDSLMKKELKGRQYQDTSTRFKKMERERNDFQRKLDRAREETRLAKQEAQKEKEEAKLVRRQLKAFMQNRDDETTSIDSNHTRTSAASSRSRGRSSRQKKALVKKASFKPLTVEELMEKDFA
mmetsp:Transcript_8840/g.21603  ORF Transcript_8840/g.21603 Transcript_8840/m.21603 type:complete len:583 (-) Transcript_8840:204-1952(-)|eukprot:CAMPEP_0197173778 /NCGR_PEP_ID=MMETSP1423-20130617/571_1 /TAXON_ID=476441 /ORGANISM="Pseudo-nitzschia heimii, Strain UNC1101" /LENGTH=582 /DNA_ID=CAMNT_0042622635 /DNA_START=76 /DNA_END=1824 /DNA_ORIENTATION=+